MGHCYVHFAFVFTLMHRQKNVKYTVTIEEKKGKKKSKKKG